MDFFRRSAVFILTAFTVIGAVTLPSRPARAQGLFTIGNIVSAAPGGSGSFDVLLTAVGGALSVGGFSAEPFLNTPGVTFTAADFSTGTPYIFPDSFDRDNGLTLSDEMDHPFPNTDLTASDGDNQTNSAVTIADGATVGLAHVTYQFDAADAPASAYTVAFNPDGTSLSDGIGTQLSYNTAPGTLTASPSAAPEPSEWAALGFTGMGIGSFLLKSRKRTG